MKYCIRVVGTGEADMTWIIENNKKPKNGSMRQNSGIVQNPETSMVIKLYVAELFLSGIVP